MLACCYNNPSFPVFFLSLLDSVFSLEEFELEKHEALFDGFNLPEMGDPILFEVWQELEKESEMFHKKIYDVLLKLLAGHLRVYSASHALCFDGLRDLWGKLMLNFFVRGRFETSELFLGFPLKFPGFPTSPKDCENEEDLFLSLKTPEEQRCALLFLESFLYLIDRDVSDILFPERDMDIDIRVCRKQFRSSLIKLLDSDEVDETTKFFALRTIDACPMLVTGGCKPPVPMLAKVMHASQEPIVLYQVCSVLVAVTGVMIDDGGVEDWLRISDEEYNAMLEALFQAMLKLRRMASSPDASIGECANAAFAVESAVDALVSLWLQIAASDVIMPFIIMVLYTLISFSFLQAERRGKVLQYLMPRTVFVVQDLLHLSQKNSSIYTVPTLFVDCARSLTPSQVYGDSGVQSMGMTGTQAAQHAFYSRLFKGAVLLQHYTFLSVLITSEYPAIDSRLLLEKAFLPVLGSLVDTDIYEHIENPEAFPLFQEHTMMEQIVNGGHLDPGVVPFDDNELFLKLNSLKWKIFTDFFISFDNLLDKVRAAELSIESASKEDLKQKWSKILQSLPYTDDPKLIQRLYDELRSESCSPRTCNSIRELMKNTCFVLTNTIAAFSKLFGTMFCD